MANNIVVEFQNIIFKNKRKIKMYFSRLLRSSSQVADGENPANDIKRKGHLEHKLSCFEFVTS